MFEFDLEVMYQENSDEEVEWFRYKGSQAIFYTFYSLNLGSIKIRMKVLLRRQLYLYGDD